MALEGVSGGTEQDRVLALINAIIRVLGTGRCDSEDVLQGRLEAAGVPFEPDDLTAALQRSTDSGRLMRPRPRPTAEQPNRPQALILANLPRGFSQSGDPFDRIDGLAADVHALIKRRSQLGFDSDDQLTEWLVEELISCTPEELRDSLEQLEVAGWLSRPHRLREFTRDPLPGYLDTPSWARSW